MEIVIIPLLSLLIRKQLTREEGRERERERERDRFN